ncbi:MAG: hypothetical protein ACOCWC_05720 [Bacteroidota bacterium]
MEKIKLVTSNERISMFLRKGIKAIMIFLIIVSVFAFFISLINAIGINAPSVIKVFNNFSSSFYQNGFIYASMFVAISAFLTIEALYSSKGINEGKAILELRRLLIAYDDIHLNLRGEAGKWVNGIPNNNNEENNEIWGRIDAYLGIFELCGIWIKQGTISFKNFESQFGYRLTNAMYNCAIRKKIEAEKDNWCELLELYEKVK